MFSFCFIGPFIKSCFLQFSHIPFKVESQKWKCLRCSACEAVLQLLSQCQLCNSAKVLPILFLQKHIRKRLFFPMLSKGRILEINMLY